MTSRLIPILFYTVPALAERLGCSNAEILNYALTEQLRLSVRVYGRVEQGYIDVDVERSINIPVENKRHRGTLFRLTLQDQRELLENGVVLNSIFDDPEFEYSVRSYDDEITLHLKDVVIHPLDANSILQDPTTLDNVQNLTLEKFRYSTDEGAVNEPKRTVVGELPNLFEHAVKIFDQLLRQHRRDPTQKQVLNLLLKMPEFQNFTYETVRKALRLKEIKNRWNKLSRQ